MDGRIDRASPEDLVSLATDVGPAPMQVGAVLLLDHPLDHEEGLEPAAIVAALGERITTVPRLRQVLRATPLGGGRPIWVDDPRFALERHVTVRPCDPPGDEGALLTIAAEVVGTALPRDHPLWRMALVTGLAGDRAALVVAFHHVLADGIGGLAVLASLVDGAAVSVDPGFPRAGPTASALRRDAWTERARALGHVGATAHRVREALTQLRSGGTKPVRCSLDQPTGPHRHYAVVRADVTRVRRQAHVHGATVNDVVLTAATGALRRLLASRGEQVDELVVSVPVSARAQTSATELGNEVGVVPIVVPLGGEAVDRLAEVARRTTAAKQTARGASTAVIGPLFRLLAWLRVFRWFINRQRLVHTFTTNVRGPAEPLTLLGARIIDAAGIAVTTGNVTVSLAALSYAGTLAITVIADVDTCPDLDVVVEGLRAELHALGIEASPAPLGSGP